MLYQEDDPESDDGWITADEWLTFFSKSIEQVVGRVCKLIPVFIGYNYNYHSDIDQWAHGSHHCQVL